VQQVLGQRWSLPSSLCWSCLPWGIRGTSHCAATVHRCAIPTALPWLWQTAATNATTSSLASNANSRFARPAARTSAAAVMAQAAIPAALTIVWMATAQPATVTTATPPSKIVAYPPAATDIVGLANSGSPNSACHLASRTAMITA